MTDSITTTSVSNKQINYVGFSKQQPDLYTSKIFSVTLKDLTRLTLFICTVSLLFLFVRFIALNRMRAGKKLPSNEKTAALVKRCCILTTVCIITDVVMLVVTTLIKGHVPEIVSHAPIT